MSEFQKHKILLVDDDVRFLYSMKLTLISGGMTHVGTCDRSKQVLAMLDQDRYSLLVLDLIMPEMSGLDLLPVVRERYPDLPVIVMTAVNEVEAAVQSLKAGAYDYIVKPVEPDLLLDRLRRALEHFELRTQTDSLREYLLTDRLRNTDCFSHFITRNAHMRNLFKYIESIAASSMPVLISGETGVGKELMARSVHCAGGWQGDFVAVNIAGLDDTMFSDTLFGHKAGSYTGATAEREGLVERANGGTLFLDEIGDLELHSQVKLLRLIQERTFYPLGSDRLKRTNARIVCSTNRDLFQAMEKGEFRRDLFYRLHTYHVHIPPLRERKEDIQPLVRKFAVDAAKMLRKNCPVIPSELFALLERYPFPGNVRELEGIVHHALSVERAGTIPVGDIQERLFGPDIPSGALDTKKEGMLEFGEKLPTLQEMNRLLIDEALRRGNGNQSVAAKMVGLTRRALNKRLSRRKKEDHD